MSRQSKRLPSTPLTVSDVPSSATEPFGGDEARQSCGGASKVKRVDLAEIVAADDGRDAVDMAGDDVAAELVADLERALEIDARCRCPIAEAVVASSVSGAASTSKTRSPSWPSRRDDRQADAGAGDRGADRDASRRPWRR